MKQYETFLVNINLRRNKKSKYIVKQKFKAVLIIIQYSSQNRLIKAIFSLYIVEKTLKPCYNSIKIEKIYYSSI